MGSKTTDLNRGETPSGDAAAQGRVSLRPLLALKPLILAHKGALWGAVIAVILSAVAMLAVPMAVRRMIDNGFAAHDADLINSYFLTLIGIGLLLAIASPARYYFVNWIGERVVADLRTKVFAQLSKLGPAYFDVNHSGEIMSRLTADTTQIKAVAGSSLSQAARNFIMLIGALVMMFVSSAKLSLLVFIAIPIIVLPLVGFGRLVRRLSRTAQDTLADASAYAAENLAAHRTMQAYVNEQAVTGRFSSAVERAFDADDRRAMRTDAVAARRLIEYLNALEAQDVQPIYLADGGLQRWARRCMAQADRILLVIDARDREPQGEMIEALHASGARAPVDLVIVRADGVAAPDVLGWRLRVGAQAHYFVRPDHDDDLRWLDVKVDAIKHHMTAERFAQATDADNRPGSILRAAHCTMPPARSRSST